MPNETAVSITGVSIDEPTLKRLMEELHLEWSKDWEQNYAVIREHLIEEQRNGSHALATVLSEAVTLEPDFFDQVDQRVVTAAENRAAELIGKRVVRDAHGKLTALEDNPSEEWAIDERLRETVRTKITEAMATGMTATELQESLMESGVFAPARALMIARSESRMASEAGARTAIQATGLRYTKQWIPDADPCTFCELGAADGPIPSAAVFSNGAFDVGDSHPSCRCNTEYEIAEDQGDAGEETEE